MTVMNRHRAVAALTMVMILFAVSHQCLSAAQMTDEERLCCATMAGDCSGAASIKHDCCGNEPAGENASTSPVGLTSGAAPSVAVVAILPSAAASARLSFAARATGAWVRPPSSPTYLLVSIFRI